MESSEGFARGRDGSPIYYRVRGAAHQPTILLCDGIGCEGYIWKYLETDLPERGWRIVHWHYRGHGQTPPPKDPDRVTLYDLADDLAAVLDAVGVEHAVLAGHSMGVQVVLESVRQTPERARALLLISGSYGHPLRTFRGSRTWETFVPLLQRLAQNAPNLARKMWRTLLPTELSFEVAKLVEVNPDLVRRADFFPYLEGISRVDPLLFLRTLASAAEHTARDLLPQIRVPALVISGDRDGFTPAALSREMAGHIPGAELLIVEGGSHTLPIERPDVVGAAILDFLARRCSREP